MPETTLKAKAIYRVYLHDSPTTIVDILRCLLKTTTTTVKSEAIYQVYLPDSPRQLALFARHDSQGCGNLCCMLT